MRRRNYQKLRLRTSWRNFGRSNLAFWTPVLRRSAVCILLFCMRSFTISAVYVTLPQIIHTSVFVSGSGPNGAIVHYRAEAATCGHVDDKLLFLLDSGAQFVDGTTDITRTVHFGTPSARQKECFTRVLQVCTFRLRELEHRFPYSNCECVGRFFCSPI